jgi:hypothetical protein
MVEESKQDRKRRQVVGGSAFFAYVAAIAISSAAGVLPVRWAALLLLIGVTATLSIFASVRPRGFTWTGHRAKVALALAAGTFLVSALPAAIAVFASSPLATQVVSHPGDQIPIPSGWRRLRLRIHLASTAPGGSAVHFVLGGGSPAVDVRFDGEAELEGEGASHGHAHAHGKEWTHEVTVDDGIRDLRVLVLEGEPPVSVSVNLYPSELPPTWLVIAIALAQVVASAFFSARAPLGELGLAAIVVALGYGLGIRQAALADELSLRGLLVTLLGCILAGGLAGLMLSSALGVFIRRRGAPRTPIRRR